MKLSQVFRTGLLPHKASVDVRKRKFSDYLDTQGSISLTPVGRRALTLCDAPETPVDEWKEDAEPRLQIPPHPLQDPPESHLTVDETFW